MAWYKLEQMQGVSPGSSQEAPQVCNSELRKFDRSRKDLALQPIHTDSFEQIQASYTAGHSEAEEEQAVDQTEVVCCRQAWRVSYMKEPDCLRGSGRLEGS